MCDFKMSPNEIDDTDLDLMLDMEVLDSKIDAAAREQSERRAAAHKRPGRKNSSTKHRAFSGGTAFIDQIMNF